MTTKLDPLNKKLTFSDECKNNWRREIFVVESKNNTNLVIYNIKILQ